MVYSYLLLALASLKPSRRKSRFRGKHLGPMPSPNNLEQTQANEVPNDDFVGIEDFTASTPSHSTPFE